MSGFFCFALTFLMFVSNTAHSLDFSIRAAPLLTVPVEQDGAALYTTGGGAQLSAELDFRKGISSFAEAALSIIPLRGSTETMGLSTIGAGLSFSFYPIPRIEVRTAASSGFYNASILESSRHGIFWAAQADAGYRFSPGFSVLGTAAYISYLSSPKPSDTLFNGLSIGLSLNIALGSASSRTSGLSVESIQFFDILPLSYYTHTEQPFGSITIHNNESAEIRDLSVLFESEGLTSTPLLCGSTRLLHRKGSIEVPLLAAFNDRVLEFTENAKAQGRIVIQYKLLDTPMEKSFPAVVSFKHRNALQWKNPAAAAAFASPNDPAVLDLSKYISGLIRERIRPDIDHSFQYGMGLFEGIRLVGLDFSPDPSTPYSEFRNKPEEMAYVQYPYQTFAYRGGDSDDLALMYISTLASVGLETAFIPLQEKAYAAFALDLSPLEARLFFTDPSLFAWIHDKVWVIVDTTRFREGFMAAWYSGAQAWNKTDPAEQETSFITMTDAWQQYRPLGISAEDLQIAKPRQDRIDLAFENSLGRFISIELTPKAERMRADMSSGGGSARQLNALGILYAQYGLLEDARNIFAQAVQKGSRTALVNMANVSYLLEEYSEAATLYNEVLKYDPANKAAILGLAKSRYELDAYAEADDLFIQLNSLDPSLAERFAYLSSRVGTGNLRASSATDSRTQTIWQEE